MIISVSVSQESQFGLSGESQKEVGVFYNLIQKHHPIAISIFCFLVIGYSPHLRGRNYTGTLEALQNLLFYFILSW